MLKSFKNGIVFGTGFMLIIGVVFAATISVENVGKDKTASDTVSFSEFNDIVGTIRNIYNDNDNNYIGIGEDHPKSALDVNGNIKTIIKSCPKLGTDANGKIICK